MLAAPIPSNEIERQQAVQSLGMLDTPNEARFDRITRAAAAELHAPICTISLIDEKREWFKSCVGLDTKEGSREHSFCGRTITKGSMFIVNDTLKDTHFKNNPAVVNAPYIRFYAGITLYDKASYLPVGALCIKDTKPRSLSSDDLNTLINYAKQAEKELNSK